jgi:hypothetical protein
VNIQDSDLKTWDAWREIHQPFELQWWREALEAGHSRDDQGFVDQWDPVREFIHPYGQVIDIGCGPRPPFAPCIAIEPLAREYLKLVPKAWWKDVTILMQPAEDVMQPLCGQADTVIC